jgi:hypothetical protein
VRNPPSVRRSPSSAGSPNPNPLLMSVLVSRPMCLPLPCSIRYSVSMQNKQLVKIVVWIVVVGMVLALAVTAISLF